MRNLTIKRTKTFVGSLAKLKIYIEDPTSREITINNTPCRKIGELKNGEEKTFQIGEQAAKVFVIADKLSKNICNEYYQISDGQEDVFLSGKNKFNLANGNAFRFDNNNSEEVIANRKRGTRKGLLVLAIAIIVGLIVGCLIGFGSVLGQKPEAKTFSSDGMTITLTNEFYETDIEGYTVTYDSKNVGVFVLKEEFTLAEGFENYSLEEYADLVIENNNLESSEIKTGEGLTYFEYEFVNSETNDTYRFFSYVYKTDDAFWLVQFALLNKNVDSFSQQITEWAKSIVFSN